MNDDPKFTLYWRDGKREVVQGRNPAEAMTLAGYGGGAVAALDFWASGENDDYEWDAKAREWKWTEAKRQRELAPLAADQGCNS